MLVLYNVLARDGVVLDRAEPLLMSIRRAHDTLGAGGLARLIELLDGHSKKFLALLRDPAVSTIVVEHRDRFARFGAEYVEAALSVQGRRLLVVDPAEVDDDLVDDVTEILTSLCARLCARLYGRHAAVNRARRAVEAATGDGPA